MPLVIPIVGQAPMLNQFLNQWHPWFHLYTIDVVLGDDTVLEDFTEPDWSGYAPIRTPSWVPAVEGPPASSYCQPLTWTRGMGGTTTQVFGFFVTALKDGPLMYVSRRDFGPIAMNVYGQLAIVTPSLSLQQINQC